MSNVDDDEEPLTISRKGQIRDLELSSFEGGNNLILTIEKNFILKRRRLRGCVCEIFKPPLFMVALIIAYYAANVTLYPTKNYATQEIVDLGQMLTASTCTVGVPAAAPNPESIATCSDLSITFCCMVNCDRGRTRISHIKEIPGVSGIWSRAFLCSVPPDPNPWENFDQVISLLESPTIAPGLDSMFILKKLSRILYGRININIEGILNSLRQTGEIEFVQSVGVSCEVIVNMINYLSSNYLFFESFFSRNNNLRSAANPSCPLVWPSEHVAVDTAVGDGAGRVWVLIIINQFEVFSNPMNPIFNYRLRMNYTSTPFTHEKKDRFSQGLGKKRYQQYIVSGFTTIQRILDEYFANINNDSQFIHKVVSTPTPTGEYSSSEFFERAGAMIPLILSLSFVYTVSCLVGSVVEEKEGRYRESMLIMGVSKNSIIGSWLLTYLAMTTASCCCIAVVSKMTFMSKSSLLLIFIIFELFAFSLICMALLISVFFSKSRIAAIVAPLVMFITAVPKFFIPESFPLNAKIFVSFLSPCAFSYSTELLTGYESIGRGSNFTHLTQDEYSYLLSIAMLILDSVVYLLLMWYLDQVLPSEFGVRKSVFFPFHSTIALLRRKVCSRPSDKNTINDCNSDGSVGCDISKPSSLPVTVESFHSSEMKSNQKTERIVISGLKKCFSKSASVPPAVDCIGSCLPRDSRGGGRGLTFHEGEIQCVLGHNGAGKTTLINLLTGMLKPSEGTATIFGHDIRTAMNEIRKLTGLCPQHNILWDRMTCTEHLRYYGQIKGIPVEVLNGLDGRINQMLRLINIFDKRDAWSCELSGGQKRKLSVACALIGGSKLVFLDEPTAGMDVDSRRAMWQLLRRPDILKGRVIILTTHYMDEADLLGDNVMIMNKGCLHSWGSAFFLKTKMGLGYNMSFSLKKGGNHPAITNTLRRMLPRCWITVTSVTNGGNELRVNIPVDYNDSNTNLLNDLQPLLVRDYYNDHDSEQTIEFINKIISFYQETQSESQTSSSENELINTVTQPQVPTKELLEQFKSASNTIRNHPIEKAKELGLNNDCYNELREAYFKSSTAVREVVTKLLSEIPEHQCQILLKRQLITMLSQVSAVQTLPMVLDEIETQKDVLKIESYGVGVTTLEEVFLKIALNSHEVNLSATDNNDSHVTEYQYSQLYSITSQLAKPASCWSQFKGLLVKRYHCGKRDRRTLLFQFVLPVFFITIALLLSRISLPHQPNMTLDGFVFDSPTKLPFIVIPPTAITKSNVIGNNGTDMYDLLNIKDEFPLYTSSLQLSTWMIAKQQTNIGIGAVYPDSTYETQEGTVSTSLHNATYAHGWPAGSNLLHNAMLRVSGKNYTITTDNHPMPMSRYEQNIIDSFMIVLTSLFIMIPFTFIPSNFISFIVKERSSKAKHIQTVSGIRVSLYWLTAFIADFVLYLITVALVFVVFWVDDRKEFIGTVGVFSATLSLFVMYGISSIATCYLMSFLFEKHTTAQNTIIAVNFLAGFVLVIASQVLDLLDTTKEINKHMKNLYRVIPSFCLGEGIINIAMVGLLSIFTKTESPFAWEQAGADLTYMATITPIVVIITLYLELPPKKKLQKNQKASEGDDKSMNLTRSSFIYGVFPSYFAQNTAEPVTEGTPLFGKKKKGLSKRQILKEINKQRGTLPIYSRKGNWLQCTCSDTSHTYYFNEATGESRWEIRGTPFYEDPAVLRHASEILNNDSDTNSSPNMDSNEIICVKNLTKVWKRSGSTKLAVDNLTFAVPKGELFAFLGTNGAGKSTTLAMLTGDVLPTSGSCKIGNFDISNPKEAPKARRLLGFCPQFDACLENMTVDEHLIMFARLRGVPEREINKNVEILVGALSLGLHRKKTSKELSGGNRRKLSVAIALMGAPPVVMLDEPSAGMDPVARRGLWVALEKIISQLNISVILTTHHLEEIEGLRRLSHRVTIMVAGRLRCLGSLTQLKESHGFGYELTVKASPGKDLQVRRLIEGTWLHSVLIESVQNRFTYQIPKEVVLSQVFSILETSRSVGIVDYSIDETSLEQVFIKIGEQQQTEEEMDNGPFQPTPPSTPFIVLEDDSCLDEESI